MTRVVHEIQTGKKTVSGVWYEPRAELSLVLLLGHGAGANREHHSMTRLAETLGEVGVRCLLFNFPYKESGRKAPDSRSVLLQTWLDVFAWAGDQAEASGAPLWAGGRSMGGRYASLAAAEKPELFHPDGLVFFAYPLHPPGRTDQLRDAHLPSIKVPMLFLSGTRDSMAEVELLSEVVKRQGASSRLVHLDGADHGFHVLKRSGRTDDEVHREAARALIEFSSSLPGAGKPGVAKDGSKG